MYPDNKNLIGQLVSLRMHSPYLPNGQKDVPHSLLVLDTTDSMLIGYFTDEIQHELFARPSMLPLTGEIRHSITGVADGKGVLLRLEEVLQKLHRTGKLILFTDEQRQKYFGIYSPAMELVQRARGHVEQQQDREQLEPDTPCTGSGSEAEDSYSKEIVIRVPQEYRLKTITLEEAPYGEE